MTTSRITASDVRTGDRLRTAGGEYRTVTDVNARGGSYYITVDTGRVHRMGGWDWVSVTR